MYPISLFFSNQKTPEGVKLKIGGEAGIYPFASLRGINFESSQLFSSKIKPPKKGDFILLRRGWDSNPGLAFTNSSFQDCLIRPL